MRAFRPSARSGGPILQILTSGSKLARAASTARKRFERMAAVKQQRLKDDIDENTGLCSEPELNFKPHGLDYTDV